MMLITEIRREKCLKGQDTIEIEYSDESTKHFQKMQQKIFLAELDQMCSPLSRSLDHLGLTFSCSKCDPRMLHLSKVPVEANIELRDCITFSPPDIFNHGKFVYNLLFSGLIEALPVQKMKEDAYNRTKKLVSRINVNNGAVAKLASMRLQQLYSRNNVAWVNEFDKTHKLIYLPLHCVVKPSSSSTQARVCVAPNVLYHTPMGQVSYNSALKNISSTQPRFYRFLLQHQTALTYAVCDISQQFNRCHFSYSSSLLNITLAMRSRKGSPTYVKSDCDDTTLHPLRHGVCGFGQKQTPQVAQCCQQSAVRMYKQYNADMSPTDLFILDICDGILKRDCWMDDVFIYVGLALLTEWMALSDISVDDWHDHQNEKEREQYIEKIRSMAEALLVTICSKITEVLQFSGFKIKHFITKNTKIQKKLDQLVSDQKVGNDDEQYIEVCKPSQKELYDQLQYLSPQKDFPPFQPEETQAGVPHLGLLYNEGKVNLLKHSLSFAYSLNGKKAKSPELRTFLEFENWRRKIKPNFTRRSLFSLVAATQDATGRHLALYRARMKLLIRQFLIRNQDQVSTWESVINQEEERLLVFNVELYFHLVKKTVYEPKVAKFCTKRTILALSDGSDSLYAISISVVYSYCVNGVTRREATHLCLIPYTAHVQMINILWIEMTGMSKLLQELGGYLTELKSIGIDVPAEHIYIGTDSMILIKLLRSKVHLLQKSSGHKCAKILIQLNTLGLNAYDSLYWTEQKVMSMFPDYISKRNRDETCQSVLRTYEKLFDFSWLTSGSLPNLPGFHAELPEPKSAELSELKDTHVLASEWDSFCQGQGVTGQENIVTLTAAARKHCSTTACCGPSDTLLSASQATSFPPIYQPPKLQASPNISISDGASQTKLKGEWKYAVDLLIQRRFCYGLNARGCIGILQKCLEFGRKLKHYSKLGVLSRKERQLERKHNYLEGFRLAEEGELINPLQQGHQLLAKAVDPLSLTWGDVDQHLHIDRLPGEGQVGGGEEDIQRQAQEVSAGRIFHLMTSIFKGNDQVKHFSSKNMKDKYGKEISVLIGRRQRNNFGTDKHVKELRLRPIESNSMFEKLLLFSAHQASFNNLSKAKVSIYSLNVYISKLEEKLRDLQRHCSSCNLTRGRRNRLDDLVKNSLLGPSSQLYRVQHWLAGESYHMIDLAGPAHMAVSHQGRSRKFYILLALQLPLKQLTCIPLKDYSTQSLYLGLLEYSAKIGGEMRLVAADSGSQLGSFQNAAMGYEEGRMDTEGPEEKAEWVNLILGRRKQQLENNHIFLKIISGAHKHLAPIEQCVSVLKFTLASFNKRLTSSLDMFQWNYVLRLTEKTILTRPLAASSTGRIWTPQCLLNLLGRADHHDGDLGGLDPKAKTNIVVADLERFEQRMLVIRQEVAHILADALIQPSFFETLTKEEKVKRRERSNNVQITDIFFCPILYARTFHTGRSLLRLIVLNDARTGGVFAKAGPPGKSRLITRDLSYLYFVCKGTRDTVLESDWTPSFKLREIFQQAGPDTGMSFGNAPTEQEITEAWEPNIESDEDYDQWMGVGAGRHEGGEATPPDPDQRGGGEQTPGENDEDVFFSRYGRRLTRTKHFGI